MNKLKHFKFLRIVHVLNEVNVPEAGQGLVVGKRQIKIVELNITTCGRILLKKLLVILLEKKFHTFTGDVRFITMFTRASYWSMSWAKWTQFTSSHTVSLRSVLILLSHLHLGLSSGFFLSVVFDQNFVCVSRSEVFMLTVSSLLTLWKIKMSYFCDSLVLHTLECS